MVRERERERDYKLLTTNQELKEGDKHLTGMHSACLERFIIGVSLGGVEVGPMTTN